MKKILPSLLIIMSVCVFLGQAQEITGNLEGWVVDLKGNPIPGAVINISGSALQGKREINTNERGYFRTLGLPIGLYSVKIQHPAFHEINIQNVSVRLGKATTLGEIVLQSDVIKHEILVTAKLPIIDPSTSAAEHNLQDSSIEQLPTDRDLYSLISLLPNANASFFGDGVNISGSTGGENIYYIDGMNVTDPLWARGGTNLPYNFVKEIQLKTAGYQAEYGRSAGGIVNMITYSGGNEFQGHAFSYFTNSALADDMRMGLLDTEVNEFSTYDLGVSLGGPIVRDKLWFFVAYDQAFENKDIEYPVLGIHRDRVKRHTFAGKLTWQASSRINVIFSVFGDPTTADIAEVESYGAPISLESVDTILAFEEKGGINFSLQARSYIWDNLFLEASVARYEKNENLKGATEKGRNEPFFQDLTTDTWSGGFGSHSERHMTRLSFLLKATLFVGNHTIKAGVEYEDNYTRSSSETTSPGKIMKINENFYEVLYWQNNNKVHNRIPSFFLQDSWQVFRRFRLNIGLRWEGQYFIGADSKLAQSITDQFQPRLGFTLQVGKLGSHQVFGSLGRFYQQIPLNIALLAYGLWENYSDFYSQDPRDPDAVWESRNVIVSGAARYLPEVEGLRGQYFDEVTAGYEGTFFNFFKLGIRVIYRHLRERMDVGFKKGAPPSIGNPGRGDLSWLPPPKRNYTALELTLKKMGGDKLKFAASYVLSRNYGNYTGLYNSDQRKESPNNYFSLQLEEQAINSTGLLPNDRTHVLKLFGSYRFDFGLTSGAFFTWQSGTPLNELGATWLIYRPMFLVKRGSAGRTPSIWDLNFRFTYDIGRIWRSKIKPRLVFDILHVGSPRKAVDMDQIRFQALDENENQTAPNPNFGGVVLYQPPMTARLGIEISF